jgi:hypothetical protein
MNNTKGTFMSDNLTFVAAALILDKATIEYVIPHPSKPGVKMFILCPKEDSTSLYMDYISDKLKVSPQLLNAKIAAIRRLPVEGEGNNDTR